MDWNQLTDMQRLAVMQALYKQLEAEVSTKDVRNLRGSVDAQLIDWYRATGAKSYDINSPSGMKVGTFSVNVSKEVPEQVHKVFDIADMDEFTAWLETDDGLQIMLDFIHSEAAQFVAYVLANTGELPGGIELKEIIEPAQPPHVKGTTLRVDVPKVASAFRAELPSAVAGLLGGAR